MGNLEHKRTNKSKFTLYLLFYHTQKLLFQHLPWANNRPYKDGDLYNCLVIETKMKDVGKPHFETEELTVIDEVHSNSSIFCLVHFIVSFIFFCKECGVSYCPICRMDKKVRHIKVRGLCSESMYNTVYILTLSEEGTAIYFGQYTSSIMFNKTTQQWQWYDQKDNQSIATR